MSNITLYGAVYSTCTQRVLLVLHELGLDYDMASIDLMKGAHKDPSYTQQVNPFGKVPALKDGDLVIFESRAICRYLVTKYASKAGGLALPHDAAQVAVFEQAASVEYSYFDPPITQIAYERMFKSHMGHGATDDALVEKLEGKLFECLDYYESLLSKQKFLGGQNASLIDLWHMPWFGMFTPTKLESAISSRPNLNKWWTGAQQKESWTRIMKELKH